ncbi:MAG TPA: hypothetical protein VNI84_07950 [Pyrinomonadaceae bacterium]|nr:hypothetical protein [Pyrinomonadaceae bacterium]
MLFKILQIAVPFVWFGMIGAISFMEAPLKFQAPNITIPLGLGIGRLVFFALNKIEIGLAILMLASFFFARPRNKFPLVSFGIIALLLILETVWLLPVLDARATEVISGTAEAFSNGHFIYIVFDAIKFILLLVLGVSLAKNNLKFE